MKKNCSIDTNLKFNQKLMLKQEKTPSLIIINGPSGAGKTTIAKILSQNYSCVHLDGEFLRKQLSQKTNIKLNSDDIHSDLLFLSQKYLKEGKTVIISHTIEPDFWVLYQQFFKDTNIDNILITLIPNYQNLKLDTEQYVDGLPDEEVRELQYARFLDNEVFNYSIYDNSQEKLAETIANLECLLFPIQKSLSICNLSITKGDYQTQYQQSQLQKIVLKSY